MAIWSGSPWETEFRKRTTVIRSNLGRLADLALEIMELEFEMRSIDAGVLLPNVDLQCDSLSRQANVEAECLKRLAASRAAAASTHEFLKNLSIVGFATQEQGDAQEVFLPHTSEQRLKALWHREKLARMTQQSERVLGKLDTRPLALHWLVDGLFLRYFLNGCRRGPAIMSRLNDAAIQILRASEDRLALLDAPNSGRSPSPTATAKRDPSD